MRNVSNEYIETMRSRRDFYAVAEITFADGAKKTLSKGDFAISGNSVTESAESNSFPLGILAAKRITLSLMNDDERWSEYAFYGAKISLQTKFDLDDGTTEALSIGTFTVITPESYGTVISVTAMDDSYKSDVDYSTGLSYPITAGEALKDSCRTCGITLLTTEFPNDDYVIPSKPESITHRQLIGMVAMIAGGNAVFDESNRLVIKPYDFSAFEKSGDEWGGIFDRLSEERYMTGDDVFGGVFEPWDVGEEDNPVFTDLDSIHFLYDFKSGIRVESDDVVITGIQIEGEDENGDKKTYLYGSEGYVLSVENRLAIGKEEEAVRRIGQTIIGLRFRPFSGDHIAYPLAEFMDLAYLVDRVGRAYRTVLTDVSFAYYGFTNLKCSAESPIRNSSTYYGNETKAVVQAQKIVEKERTEREKAIENLAAQLAQSSGLFMTTEAQPGGGNVYYMHDRKELSESMVVWKLTANAFGISTDGGGTYPYGLDATGTAILSRIYAIGINADYLTAGKVKAERIDVDDLFAQDIKATGSISGAKIETDRGHVAHIFMEESGLRAYRVSSVINGQPNYDKTSYFAINNLIGTTTLLTERTWLEVVGNNETKFYISSAGNIGVNNIRPSSESASIGSMQSPTIVASQFLNICAKNFFESGVALSSKYAAKVSSSDARKKNSIVPISESYERVFEQLRPVSYKFNDGHRTHTGFVSQEVEKALNENGMTGEDWAAFCKTEDGNGDYEYGLQYNEIIALNTHMIQKLTRRLNDLEEEVLELKKAIKNGGE